MDKCKQYHLVQKNDKYGKEWLIVKDHSKKESLVICGCITDLEEASNMVDCANNHEKLVEALEYYQYLEPEGFKAKIALQLARGE